MRSIIEKITKLKQDMYHFHIIKKEADENHQPLSLLYITPYDILDIHHKSLNDDY